MQFALLLVLAAVAAAAPRHAAKLGPVTYRSRTVTNADGSVNEDALRASLSRTLVKYGRAPLPAPVQARDPAKTSAATHHHGGNVRLTDLNASTVDELYYGRGYVGGTPFALEFDPGSADLFVPGPACTSCTGPTHYNNSGQNQDTATTIQYGDPNAGGQVSGENYKDTVMVANFSVPAQGFVSLDNGSGLQGADPSTPVQGVLGMAFSSISQTGYPTFMENLIAQGVLSAPQFAFYLGRAVNHTRGRSELTIGGVNSKRYRGTPTPVPVTTQGYWQVALDGVLVDNKTAEDTAGQAVIDTATTIILVPDSAADAIFSQIPGSVPFPGLSGSPSLTFYGYPCDTAAEYIPVLQFAGKQFPINPLDFNLGTIGQVPYLNILGAPEDAGGDGTGEGTNFCLAGIASEDIGPDGNLFVIGDVFLKNWYSIYDYTGPSVSFAPAVHNNPAA